MVEPKLVDLMIGRRICIPVRRLIGEDITLLVLADPTPVRVVLDPGQLERF